ncbi:MAG: hypothetical protein AB1488_02735 [Nitrospirota bacterium]
MRLLKEHKVNFVIIGATAFPVHGYARATLDIDIFIRPEKSNAERAWNTLKEFGYDVTDIKYKGSAQKENPDSPVCCRNRHPSLCEGSKF